MNQITGWKKYTVWVISVLLTLAFFMAGGAKITGAEQIVQNFEKWGFPFFFLYVVGGSEILFAIGLWVPRLNGLSALGLVALMIGAVGTHVVFGEFNQLAPATILGILSAVVFWIRYPATRELYLRIRGLAVEKG
ncbi:MAG: DoxX family protein [Proteobacteria bacterium]|nr:DoxX family protein [Pseudomonadota bacterium]